jgi:hypothetical protein
VAYNGVKARLKARPFRERWPLCYEGLGSLVERTSEMLAVALDFNFLFALRVFAVGAAVFFVFGNYTFAHRVGALFGVVTMEIFLSVTRVIDFRCGTPVVSSPGAE